MAVLMVLMVSYPMITPNHTTHISPFRIKRFHPLGYALAGGELEWVALLLLYSLKHVALYLFGLNTKFKGGIISDQTGVCVNAFQEMFLLIPARDSTRDSDSSDSKTNDRRDTQTTQLNRCQYSLT
jgi:hypothetical protein